MAARLFPDVLPYVVGTPASYGFAGFNGRTLADNAPEAMLSLVTGTAVRSGLMPATAQGQRTAAFPYVVPRGSTSGQAPAAVTPRSRPARRGRCPAQDRGIV